MLTKTEELEEAQVGDRLVSLLGRVLKISRAKNNKEHLFVSIATAEGDQIALKAWDKNGSKLRAIIKEGDVVEFEALRADEVYRQNEFYRFGFELTYVDASEAKVLEDIPTIAESFEGLNIGTKYMIECFQTGKLREMHDGTIGGVIRDKEGRKKEMFVRCSMDEFKKRFKDIDLESNKKIKLVLIVQPTKATVHELSWINEIVNYDGVVANNICKLNTRSNTSSESEPVAKMMRKI